MTRNRAAVYARLSQQGEDEESITRQIQLGTAYAKEHNLDYILYVEPKGARSGYYESKRPKWKELKRDIEAGTIRVVIVGELARAHRNAEQQLAFVNWLLQKGGQFVSLRENIDPTTAAGKMMLTMLAAANEWYRNDVSERKHRQYSARNKEIYASNVHPYGMTRTGHYPDIQWSTTPDFANIVLLAELYTTGYAYPEIARSLTKRGITWIGRNGKRSPVSPFTLDNTINAFERYKPFFERDGKTELYNAVIARREQQRLKNTRHRATKNDPFLLSRLLYCETCGALLVSQTQHADRKRKPEYVAYRYVHRSVHCPIGSRHFRVDHIDAQVLAQLEFLGNLSEAEKQEMAHAIADPPPDTQLDRYLERDRLLTKLANLEEAYLAGDLGELKAARPNYLHKKAQWEKELSELPAPVRVAYQRITYQMAYDSLCRLSERIAELQTLDPKQANLLMHSLIHKVLVDADGNARVELTPANSLQGA